MKLFFVTGNRDKFEEVKKVTDRHGIELEWSDVDVVEQKLKTEKEVSIAKALSALKILNKPVLVEDTGIYFEAYRDFPGPNAKVVFNGVGINGILKLLEGKPRKAKFVTSFAFATPKMHPVAFIGECEGRIAEKPSEVIDFAYDAIFIPDGESRTFSEMGKEEKEKHSHRAKALEEFIRWHKSTKKEE
ncbi:MAG: RdgB/HAM1 family non-canonical purine NTP pyrophosphatase [Candidatus Nanoarchaeia archaeon]|nr:RdgB/HAM1 family non-canonical purine NTP pyrophosphatase [Candidatus Nanoarchaeia archaeon]